MAGLMGILAQAGKEFPGTKIFWIALTLAATSAMIATFELGVQELVVSGIYIFATIIVFGLVLLVYNALSNSKVVGAKWLASFCAWSITLLIVGSIFTLTIRFLFAVDMAGIAELFPRPPATESASVSATEETAIDVTELRPATEPQGTTRGMEAGGTDGGIDACLDAIDRQLGFEAFEARVRECL
jgi:hypothetical protein